MSYSIKDCGCLFNRSLPLMLLIFICFNGDLKAINHTKGDFLSMSIIESIRSLNIPLSSSFMIFLQIPEVEGLNRFMIQKTLLESDYAIVESEQFADYTIQIKAEESFVPRRTSSFLRGEELTRQTSFIVQFLRMSDSQVLGIKQYNYEEKYTTESSVKDKWYNPILVTFVIGSLVYLLYFGT